MRRSPREPADESAEVLDGGSDSRGDLRGTIVISGGLGGLGAAMAAEVIGRGAHAVLIGRRPPSAVADRLAVLGDAKHVSYVQADAVDRDTIGTIFAETPDLRAAIANAGVTIPEPFLTLSPDAWRTTMRVNLDGTFEFAQAAARRLVELDCGGSLVLVGSWIQEAPEASQTAYSVSKAAVRMLARCMALELGPKGIRVNTLAPGIVDAGMAKRHADADPEYASRARHASPLDRLQTREEVAKTAAFLCSDASSSVTGSVLLADCGVSLSPGRL